MIEVDALLFDLDGTLIDSKKDIAEAVRHVQKAYGATPSSDDEIASFIGDGVVTLIERALPSIRDYRFAEALETMKTYYRAHCLDHTTLYPGVREVLFHFREKSMAVVTNKPERASRLILKGLGISEFFPVVVGGNTLPTKKPDAAPIHFALRRLNIQDARRAVMIGDSVNDVLAGKSAGTRTCGIFSNIEKPERLQAALPDLMISNLRELPNCFA